jgi:hypothetical protein
MQTKWHNGIYERRAAPHDQQRRRVNSENVLFVLVMYRKKKRHMILLTNCPELPGISDLSCLSWVVSTQECGLQESANSVSLFVPPPQPHAPQCFSPTASPRPRRWRRTQRRFRVLLDTGTARSLVVPMVVSILGLRIVGTYRRRDGSRRVGTTSGGLWVWE